MPYTVYENRSRNLARVHRDTCPYLKMHGGVSTTVPADRLVSRGVCDGGRRLGQGPEHGAGRLHLQEVQPVVCPFTPSCPKCPAPAQRAAGSWDGFKRSLDRAYPKDGSTISPKE